MRITTIFICLASICGCCLSTHLSLNSPEKIVKFMKRFGYLEIGENMPTVNSRKFAGALRFMQKFGSLPVTGKLDKETLKLLSTPRCGVPDITTYPNGSRKWNFELETWKKRTLTYFFDTGTYNWSLDLKLDLAQEELKNAFSRWADITSLKFKPHKNAEADIIVSFEPIPFSNGVMFDGVGGVLAYTFYPYSHKKYGGNIYFDNNETWVNDIRNKGGTDFLGVAIHHIGHILGLGHSTSEKSVMFPYYKGRTKMIDDKDVFAAQFMYGKTCDVENCTHVYPPVQGNDNVTKISPAGFSRFRRQVPEIPKQSFPDICSGNIDAITEYPKESVLIFKGLYFWELEDRGNAFIDEFIYLIHLRFKGIPISITNIDAAYLYSNHTVVLFTEDLFWRYNINTRVLDGPEFLTEMGIPPSIAYIDAAMNWFGTGRTYLFSGNQYVLYNNDLRELEDSTYPRNIANDLNPQIPTYMDAALNDGYKKIFFKGDKAYRYKSSTDEIQTAQYSCGNGTLLTSTVRYLTFMVPID